MENLPLNANRHLRFQKCLPTENSQSAIRVANRTESVNIRLPLIFGPDRSIRMEDLRASKAVSRRYRNRRIGEFLKELELTEGQKTWEHQAPAWPDEKESRAGARRSREEN